MGRPAIYSDDQLLDVAAAQAAEFGPAGVTMASVAKGAAAPSGSVYHRFSSRAELLGALWLRTVGSFQDGFVAALADPDPRAAGANAARFVVRWSRRHPREAGLLLRGAGDFAAADWPSEMRAQADAQRAEVDAAISALARRLGGDTRTRREQLEIAAIDIPYAIVRRHLRSGSGSIPLRTEALATSCAEALLV